MKLEGDRSDPDVGLANRGGVLNGETDLGQRSPKDVEEGNDKRDFGP